MHSDIPVLLFGARTPSSSSVATSYFLFCFFFFFCVVEVDQIDLCANRSLVDSRSYVACRLPVLYKHWRGARGDARGGHVGTIQRIASCAEPRNHSAEPVFVQNRSGRFNKCLLFIVAFRGIWKGHTGFTRGGRNNFGSLFLFSFLRRLWKIPSSCQPMHRASKTFISKRGCSVAYVFVPF